MMEITILSPEGTIFQGQCDFVKFQALNGEIGILSNHAPMLALLKEGKVFIRQEHGKEIAVDIPPAICKVLSNRIIILCTQK